jgi:hypothetical protein
MTIARSFIGCSLSDSREMKKLSGNLGNYCMEYDGLTDESVMNSGE